MISLGLRRVWLGVLCVAMLLVALSPAVAQGAPDDPLFVYRPEPPPPPPPGVPPPPPIPPPESIFEGPCGLAVDAGGNFYVSDYYHRAVDLFAKDPFYLGQLAEADSLQGPCAVALDGLGNLYANNFHRDVVRFTTTPFDAGTVVDSVNSTGIAVSPATNDLYVNERTQIGVYSSAGTRLGQIGAGGIVDGYGLAVSGLNGRIYVPDAATNTVKIFEPTLGSENPVATIDGIGTPKGHFTSLRDAAIALDSESGEIYVADDLQPEYSERGETVVYVFDSTGGYEGRLKYSVENGLPPGLAVDNSTTASQGRVYVTSGNTELGEVYAYPAHAATTNAVPLPPLPPGAGVGGGGSGSGSGSGAVSSSTVPSAEIAGTSASSAVDAGEPALAKRASHPAKRKPGHRRKHRHSRRGSR
jgi:hypothetical protein